VNGNIFLALECVELAPVTAIAWAANDILTLQPKMEEVLAAAHAAGVCHGNISARNVLVDPENERGVVVVDWEVCWLDDDGTEHRKDGDWKAERWVFGEC
jgi:RIO-like serine/threonine protein kinase